MSDIVLTEPTAYLYNGYRLPKLTWLDTYPYVVILKRSITRYDAYCAMQPITIGVSSSNSTTNTLVQTGKCRSYIIEPYKDNAWRVNTEYETGATLTLSSLGIPIWSSHKITYPNGTSYIAASSQPSALYEGNTEVEDSAMDLYSFTVGLTFGLADGLDLIDHNMYEYNEPASQWELLYEGELTTSNELNNKNGYYVQIPFDVNTPLLSEDGESIRLTINGESKVYITVSEISIGTRVDIGNKWLALFSSNVNIQDDGDDFYLYTFKAFGYEHGLYARYPGIYNVKIEKATFEPVVYLYNGVRLPKLPEWDIEKYPYAWIRATNALKNRYWLFLQTGINYTTNDDGHTLIVKTTENCLQYYCRKADMVWVQEEVTDSNVAIDGWGPWSNFDLHNATGEIILQASEPVPVYE